MFTYTPQQISSLHSAYLSSLAVNDTPYKPLTLNEFNSYFFTSTETLEKYFLADVEHSSFIAAVRNLANNNLYITYIFVPDEFRRQGIASRLLEKLEQQLINILDESNLTIELTYRNPVNLIWYIPDTKNHEHPNAPGVDLGSPAYYFFQNRGFRNFGYQNTYHMELETYETPIRLKERQLELEKEGIIFTTYDKHTMIGFEDLLQDFNSPSWSRELTDETATNGKNRPIIGPVYQNIIYGFTGPLDIQENGRGYFAGIGVQSKMRGKGIGKVLFSLLCTELKEMGASYMTLFTGESNPARNIYEAAGFKHVRAWANMRKEINL